MIEVTLTPDEVHQAATHGLQRRLKKLEGRRADRIQKERSTWDNEVEGACAELAWCKKCNKYWTGGVKLRAKDGGNVDVRWTKHDNGGLIVYDHEDDATVFVLADGQAPTYRFVGYLTGAEAKAAGRRTGFGILVPRSRLHPFGKNSQ